MTSDLSVVLKAGKELALKRRHPWIFSGAIQRMPGSCKPGDFLRVESESGDFLAIAYFHPGHSLCGRVISFEEKPLEEIFVEKIQTAYSLRRLLLGSTTTAYRLINAEGDGIPGLVVDVYGDVFVLQITTVGIDQCRALIVKVLVDILTPKAIYEKSTGSVRELEGLPPIQGYIFGSSEEELFIEENGIHLVVCLKDGQKTGLFLDQREMRKWVFESSRGKHVLNAFSYTGGFSIAALLGGALHVDSVEISTKLQPILERNLALNALSKERHTYFCEDVFDFLERASLSSYDLMILDPPAFAKQRKDIDSACWGYKRLLFQVMKKAKTNTLLLFSSCSYYIGEELLRTLIFQTALETKREIRLIGRHRLAFDHPISLFHPEGDYLKSFILQIL